MGQAVYVSISIGISMYPTDGKDGGTLVKHADMAMFRAKEDGDNARFYEDSMEAEIETRLALESDLRGVLIGKNWSCTTSRKWTSALRRS